MEREKFLSGLRSGHHSALVIGMLIQQSYNKVQCNAAEDAIWGLHDMADCFFQTELKPHFAAEESLMAVFGKILNKKIKERILSEHRYMISLIQDGSLEALNEFAVVLAAHIYFEETEYYPILEKILKPEEKQAVALYFEKTLPSLEVVRKEK